MYSENNNTLLVTIGNVLYESLAPMQHSKPRLAHNVVLRMVEVFSLVEYVVVIDNFFST